MGLDLALGQIFIGLGLYKPVHKFEQYYRIKDPIFHHTLAKNFQYDEARWGPLNYRIVTDSLGFKDSARREVPLSSKFHRILFIGDSFTEGVGYSYEDSFVGRIADRLKKRNIEVLNAAVSSYSPKIYWVKTRYLIQKVGLKFDELFVFIDISDIQDEAEVYKYDEKTGRVVGPDVPIEEKIKDFFTDNTVIYSTLRNVVRRLKKKTLKPSYENSFNRDRSLWTVRKDLMDRYGEKGLKEATIYMDRLLKLARQNGIKMTIAVYPWPDQIRYKDLNSIQVSHWKDWSNKNNVKFINLFPVFIGKEGEEVVKKYYITGDVHWNQEGHKLVANAILKSMGIGSR